ncbi:MAG: tRNA-dihydrouridine synthase [Planctomycetes bacterium]|nr:tRNA-dihydrouridine synthase [Planctomycetota bacterium]
MVTNRPRTASAPVKALRIGALVVDPPILQAPMAGFTNFAFRRIVREFGGAGLLATEMISAEGFVRMTGGVKGAPARLWGVKDEPRPLAVQMWDNDEATLAEVGRRLAGEYGVSVVDINFGCPVKRICDAHSGSYLLSEPARVGRIVERVVQACAPTPVTAKIRLGCSHKNVTAFEVARAVEAAGAAALTVHGRVAEDYFKGSADWDRIAAIKTKLDKMPLIGNGDLDSAEKVVAAFERYGVDGVMIARAALTRPWLFREAAAALRGEPVPPAPDLAEQRALMLRHHEQIVERFGEQRGNVLMRRYACNYAQGKRGAVAFRRYINRVVTNDEFRRVVDEYFPRA